eukprot:750227-Hanusia_phi.AAC.1
MMRQVVTGTLKIRGDLMNQFIRFCFLKAAICSAMIIAPYDGEMQCLTAVAMRFEENLDHARIVADMCSSEVSTFVESLDPVREIRMCERSTE